MAKNIITFVTFFSVIFLLYTWYWSYVLNIRAGWEYYVILGILFLVSYFLNKKIHNKSLFKSIIEFFKTLPLIKILFIVFFSEMIFIIFNWYFLEIPEQSNIKKSLDTAENARVIGNIIYTDYAYLFQIAGIILLVAIIGSILLTYLERKDLKQQDQKKQITRAKNNTLSVIRMPINKGID